MILKNIKTHKIFSLQDHTVLMHIIILKKIIDKFYFLDSQSIEIYYEFN